MIRDFSICIYLALVAAAIPWDRALVPENLP
jgi:hypothetical protein